jgi:hypothetical protein
MMRVHLPWEEPHAMDHNGESEVYEYHVRGELTELLVSAFPDLQVTRRSGQTVLSGPMLDQSALFGVLGRIEALGIELIEVRRTLSPERSDAGQVKEPARNDAVRE